MIPREGKDSDSNDSRKTFIIFNFGLVLQILLDFFPPLAAAVDFIGTKKSN